MPDSIVEHYGTAYFTVGRPLSSGLYLDHRESVRGPKDAVQADCDARNACLTTIADDPSVLEPEIPFQVYQVSCETTIYLVV